MDNNSKHSVYFIPGLAAGIEIFEFIRLPEEQFDIHYLEWLLPDSKEETLKEYVKRISLTIKHKNPILVGVSFGGIIAQEIGRIFPSSKVILISSIKHHDELPKRLKLFKQSYAYKLFPSKIIANNDLSKIAFNDFLKNRAKLYDKYLHVRDENYLNWAIYNVLNWQQTEIHKDLIHIHGSEDHIFPIKNIQNCMIIDGGTHDMILTKAKRISTLLVEVLIKSNQPQDIPKV